MYCLKHCFLSNISSKVWVSNFKPNSCNVAKKCPLIQEKLFPLNHIILNWDATLLPQKCYLIITQLMCGNVRPVQVCLSTMNHPMFRDVIMCLHGSMKDGLQENNLKASYISSFAGVFVVLVAKRGDGRKKWSTGSKKKKQESPK